ncbi:E3 ubiquitin-protein ligase RNF182-like [Lampetra fluviatilis]
MTNDMAIWTQARGSIRSVGRGSAGSGSSGEEYECKICYHAYDLRARRPKLLACGHGVCSHCLSRILSGGSGGSGGSDGSRQIPCPFCRCPTAVPPSRDVSALPEDEALVGSMVARWRPPPPPSVRPVRHNGGGEMLLNPLRLKTSSLALCVSVDCLALNAPSGDHLAGRFPNAALGHNRASSLDLNWAMARNHDHLSELGQIQHTGVGIGLDQSQVFTYGQSRGTGLALNLAARQNFTGDSVAGAGSPSGTMANSGRPQSHDSTFSHGSSTSRRGLCGRAPRLLLWLLGFAYFSSLPVGIYMLVMERVALGVLLINLMPATLTVGLLYGLCRCVWQERCATCATP